MHGKAYKVGSIVIPSINSHTFCFKTRVGSIATFVMVDSRSETALLLDFGADATRPVPSPELQRRRRESKVAIRDVAVTDSISGGGDLTLAIQNLSTLSAAVSPEDVTLMDGIDLPWWSRTYCGYHDRFVNPYSLTLTPRDTPATVSRNRISSRSSSRSSSRGRVGRQSPPSVTVTVAQAPVASAQHAQGRDAMVPL
jgi:hypothetical protein